MGQKISPVAVRLQTNKEFSAAWHSERLYAPLLHKQLLAQIFLKKVFTQVGTRATKTYCVQNPASLELSTFFCSPRLFDEKFQKKNVELKVTNFFQRSEATSWQFVPNQFDWLQFQKKLAFQVFLKSKRFNTPSQALYQNQLLKYPKKIQGGLNFYLNHVESLTSQYFGSASSWTPYKLGAVSKSAEFMAEFIAYLLESQKSTKQVFAVAQKLLKKDKTVEGFKISCSGRLQGVEMAKTETKKFGKISLHVFSSKVDYAQSKASTPFGILGVKVWICYKD